MTKKESILMPSGGARAGAGRKKIALENKRKQLRIYVTPQEEQKIKELLKELRGRD